jgi:molybdenum cofactor cytidylyltransferase
VGRDLSREPFALVLAAGRGRRFAAAGGRPFKQSRPFQGAHSMVEYVCGLYTEAGLPVVCAVHPELDGIAHRLTEAGHQVVSVADADSGMGHSLAAAVAAAPAEHGWLIALADMPAIRVQTIRAVADALLEGAAICAPFHQGRRGHPVGFSSEFGPALQKLSGDEGARSILEVNRDRVQRIDVDDPGVLSDVNVPEELPGPAGD